MLTNKVHNKCPNTHFSIYKSDKGIFLLGTFGSVCPLIIPCFEITLTRYARDQFKGSQDPKGPESGQIRPCFSFFFWSWYQIGQKPRKRKEKWKWAVAKNAFVCANIGSQRKRLPYSILCLEARFNCICHWIETQEILILQRLALFFHTFRKIHFCFPFLLQAECCHHFIFQFKTLFYIPDIVLKELNIALTCFYLVSVETFTFCFPFISKLNSVTI